MKIVNISGTVNTGKTTTCRILRDRILNAKGRSFKNNMSQNFTDVYELNGKYFGIVASGDTAPIVENGFRELTDIAKENDIVLDYVFITSRTRGENKKVAYSILGQSTGESYTFITNRIQENDAGKIIVEKQKSFFLDYILSVTGISI